MILNLKNGLTLWTISFHPLVTLPWVKGPPLATRPWVKRPPAPLILSLEPTTLDVLSKCDANATLANEPPWCTAELVEADYKKSNYTLHISQA